MYSPVTLASPPTFLRHAGILNTKPLGYSELYSISNFIPDPGKAVNKADKSLPPVVDTEDIARIYVHVASKDKIRGILS